MTLPRIPSSRRMPAAVLAAALLAGACTADSDDGATTDAPPSSLAITDDSEAAASSSSTTAAPASSTTTPPTSAPSTTAAKNTTTTAAGTVYNIGPASGEILDVVGVRYDDVLNIRDQASVSGSIVATAAPFAANPQLVSGGEGLLFNPPNGGAWWKVTVNGTQAWASPAFLGQVSPNAEDLFPQLSANMASTTAPDANALINDIASALTDVPTPSVVFSTEPVGIDAIGSEATIDALGIGDDAIKGWRIRILFNNVFDDINAANPQIVGVELIAADGFPICHRGMQASTGYCT